MKEILKLIVIKILYRLSKAILNKYQPKIIAVTGNVGKTTTKDAIYTAISKFESVRKSIKSYNSEFGVPLTIIGVKTPARDYLGWFKVMIEGLVLIFAPNYYPKYLVLEVGTERPGDIESVVEWLKPDMVVVTKLSDTPVHVEAFGTKERLFAEKGNLVKALKSDGTLFLNADDKNVLLYKNLSEANVVLFGNGNGSDIIAQNYEVLYGEEKMPRGVSFEVITDGFEPMKIELQGTLGEQHSYHVLAALAVAKVLGGKLPQVAKAFNNESVTPGRVRLIDGLKESLIIDDTYNSSPVAVEEALKTLKSIKKKSRSARKIAVLGDMLELGNFTASAHRDIGKRAVEIVDILVTVGVRSRLTADEALNNAFDEENLYQFDDSIEAGKFVKDLLKPGDIVLVKGSQGMRMERCVEELMANPDDAKSLLVRQDDEWVGR